MPFDHTVTVRFFEVDRAGIVFFARVFEYCHAAYEEALMAAFGDFESFFRGSGWGTPLVHAEADYRRPMRLGERLRVEARVAAPGGRSIPWDYTVRGPEGEIRATARLVHACVTVPGFEPRDVPGEFIDALRRIGALDEGAPV